LPGIAGRRREGKIEFDQIERRLKVRRLRYGVAMSLDGFIAGPNGEHDWIVFDPAIDFAAMFAQYDTLLMGRRTYEVARTRRASMSCSDQRWVVVSSKLKPNDHPDIAILRSGVAKAVAALKAQPGKDIWLMGGGVLFRSLLDAGLVDAVEISVMPVLLGAGVPLLPEGRQCRLHLEQSSALSTGILMLTYSIPSAETPKRAG
jgi:dihydrofolate reductase